MAWAGCPIPPRASPSWRRPSCPNLDTLAKGGTCGLISPLGGGFTPGSGPAHLALFGYDPWQNQIGRGALSALGLGLDFARGDVAARLNFCTVDAEGRVCDRRAGRIPTEKGRQLCEVLKSVAVPGVELQVAAEMEYPRWRGVSRCMGLGDQVSDSDPQVTGVPPKSLTALAPGAERTVEAANAFLEQAAALLADEHPANMVLLRGFGRYPELVSMDEAYGLKALGIAGYPMYRGVAGAVGMDVEVVGWDLESEFALLESRYADYDFFYVHVKKTDSAGEDGDFELKVRLLEELDAYIPRLLALQPEVLVVTGDHSTPSIMRSHSWHPVPTVIASQWALADAADEFSERGCSAGCLGIAPSTSLMAHALAHARRLDKFGA